MGQRGRRVAIWDFEARIHHPAIRQHFVAKHLLTVYLHRQAGPADHRSYRENWSNVKRQRTVIRRPPFGGNMDKHFASAHPRKRFFLEMFTRDISLDDCILDLIDNAIDAMIRESSLDIAKSIIDQSPAMDEKSISDLPSVKLDLSTTSFHIRDTCGGISRRDAEDDVFNFGHAAGHDAKNTGRRLGAYGIGLKRAIFKIGNNFEIRSQTKSEGFSAEINIEEWAKKDNTLSDWRFPIKYIDGAKSPKVAGTAITIKHLSDEVRLALSSGTLESRLYTTIAQTYAVFLNKYIGVYLNGKQVVPLRVPLGMSEDVEPARENFDRDGVKIQLIATLASKGGSKTWQSETAGWYILCNGRLVLAANKTELTGWGAGILPNFHPKFRGFVGLALFTSDDPLKLPWTTTKRGLNRDAAVYQLTRNKMGDVGRPIIKFLDSLYGAEDEAPLDERNVAKSMQPAELSKAIAAGPSVFHVRSRRTADEKTTVRVQFEASKMAIARIKKHLGAPHMPANQIGEHAFDYFLENEGLA